MNNDIYEKSLKIHEELGGKLEIRSKLRLDTKEILSLAYSPGVAAVSKEIAKNPDSARIYTLKKNTVAIISDGSAILGLGNLGALAAIPVMEGKAAIFKEFAGVDAFPICLDTQDTEEIIKVVKQIAPVFGGINLEDISAPKCFEIEERLRKELDIPVMHDDQWGAATVTLAALINCGKLKDIDPKNFKVVISGVGAAGVATARLLHSYGIKQTLFIDSKGVINNKRADLTKEKSELLAESIIQDLEGGLSQAVIGADVFIGLSKPDVLTEDMVRSMTHNPIIFALANPSPEIMPELAQKAGAFVIATGRSDYPNQINNSLVFPGAFKAMLNNHIPQFKNEIFISVAQALADLVKNPTKEKIIPSMWDEGVLETVYTAVSKTN